ncbi:MAG TPA: right-handed parallel beta-helix repeat-containing protein [Thermoanaerobaculia bacterium]
MTSARARLPLLFVVLLIALPATASVDYYLSVTPSAFVVDPGAAMRESVSVNSPCCRTNDPTDAVVTIPLPAGSTNIITSTGPFGGAWNCDVAGTTVTCRTHLADLPALSSAPPIFVDFNVPSSTDGLRYVGQATLTTTVPDDTPSNNNADVLVNVNHLFTVTNADDFGAGSLRDTMARANESCDGRISCKMVFAGPMRIEPRSSLPAISACGLTIDGGVAAGASLDLERPVEIAGSKAGFVNGLEVRSVCGVTLYGLTINGFGANGLVLAAPTPHRSGQQYFTVEGCFIGTDTKALEARPNGLRGISIESPDAVVLVTNSTISGNQRSGIAIWFASSVNIYGCRIGLGRGLQPLGNGASGVFVNGGNAFISGQIAYNHDFGVAVGRDAAHVSTSPEGLFANGVLDYDWGLDGPTYIDPEGRMPPVPVLIDASYDPVQNKTIVHGVLPADQGSGISLLAVRLFEKTAHGYVDLEPQMNLGPSPVDLPFTVSVNGDLRGRPIVGQTTSYEFPDGPTTDSSELSAALAVHP